MATFDYDVLIVGSGFGGSVAALRAVEKGYRVGVMEAGRRWKDQDIPKTQWNLPRFLWLPAAELYGIQRIEYLDDVLVLSGAGVGGGSHVYANTLYVPPKQFFDAPEWASITDFVSTLAHRIAAFPAAGHVAVKDRVNAIALASAEEFRRDSDQFGESAPKLKRSASWTRPETMASKTAKRN